MSTANFLIGLFFVVVVLELHIVVHIVWKLGPCLLHHLQRFSPINRVSFSFLMVSFAMQNR